jgi:subtilisin family serine protease
MNRIRRMTVLTGCLLALMLIALASTATITSGADAPQQAQPTATPTRQVAVQPVNPSPTPAAPVATREPGTPGTIGGTPVAVPQFDLPATLDDLLAQYPDLQPYLDLVKDQTVAELNFAELYARIVQVYNDHGASGVAVFLDDSGILEKLGIPVSYLDLLAVYDAGGFAAVEELARDRSIINRFDEIVAYLALDSKDNLPALTETLTGLDVSVYRYLPNTEEVEIGIPLVTLSQFGTPGSLIGYLVEIFQAEHVVGARVPTPSLPSLYLAQEFTSVGGATIGAESWWAAGFTGQGLKIAIIDVGGFYGVQDRIDEGDLPENLFTNFDLDEMNDADYANDHGTLCALVIHKVAPDAELYLLYEDPASYSGLEDALQIVVDEGIQIISRSVSLPIGPRDGTDYYASLAQDFVEDTGVLWVNSAGNYGDSHTMLEFNENDDGWHDFGDGEVWMPFQAFAPYTDIAMNWNGSWDGREDNNYRFVVVDENGDEVASGAESRKGRKNDFPFQATVFQSEPGAIYYLGIENARGAGDHVLDIFIRNSIVVDWALVPEYSVAIPGDADAVLTVGATGLEVDELESYSSQGPTLDERVKPDISAPTGEILPGAEDGFFGTSGATPLAAAAAALVWQAYPEMSSYEVKSFLMDTSLDLGKNGPDSQFGAGRVALPEPDEASSGGTEVQGDDPFAEVTDISVKWNVKSKGERGVRLSMSFTVANLQGSDIAVGFGFFTPDLEVVPSPDEDYMLLGSIGTYDLFIVEQQQADFEDVTLFLPNSVFSDVDAGTDLAMVVLIFDLTDPEDPQVLWQSEPELVTIE